MECSDMNQHQRKSSGRSGRRLKLLAAVVGGAAVATMCALSMAFSNDVSVTAGTRPTMTKGASSTVAYSATMVTTVVTPPMKAKYNGRYEP
jgi:hypothetical protein